LAQEWLDTNYPLATRENITDLNIREQNLTGTLILTDFVNLEKLGSLGNNLTNLVLDNCQKLKEICCIGDNLTNLNFLESLNSKNLTILKISYTELTGDLSIISNFINLEGLWLDNSSISGSLFPLQHCKKLGLLDINNTKIDSGLEYLPKSVKEISCNGTKFEEKLRNYPETMTYVGNFRNYQDWREVHPELIANAQRIIKLENALSNLPDLSNLNLALINCHAQNLTIQQGLEVFILETEEIIRKPAKELNELRKENQEYYQTQIEIPPKS